MQTGITPAAEVAEEFNNLRMKRSYRYLIFTVSDDNKNFIISHKGAREESFEEFKENMPKDEPRYAFIFFGIISLRD